MHRHSYRDFQPMIRGYSAIQELKPLLFRQLLSASTLTSGLDLIETNLNNPSVGGLSFSFGTTFRNESAGCRSTLISDESKAAFCKLVIDFAFALVDTPSWDIQGDIRVYYIGQLRSMTNLSSLKIAS